MEDRQTKLAAFLLSLDREDRDWLVRQLLRKTRQALIPGNRSGNWLPEAELWLFNRIGQAGQVRVKMARTRIWLIFMLLRYGALRPREIFPLSFADLDLTAGLVNIRGEAPRLVPLPLEATRRMRAMLCSLPEVPAPLECDPGLSRRSLRQCAVACGIDPACLSASALRKNRAVELELSGLPYSLINLFLGRLSRNSALVTGFENPWQIIKKHIQEEAIMKTSARNIFQGKVSKIRKHGILAEVTIKTPSGLEVVSMITETSLNKLAICEGKVLNALVKAPFVSVVPDNERASAAASADNCYEGIIGEIHSDDMAEEILVNLPQGNVICALYAMGARPSKCVAKGRQALVCFSSFSVILTEAQDFPE